MKLSKCFTMALGNIISNKSRSVLTMLGIIIGIAAVIALVSMMNGITSEVTVMFDELGTTSINVFVQGRGESTRKVTDGDIYKIAAENPDKISGVSPSVSVNATIRTRLDSESIDKTVTGVSEVYAQMTKTEVAEGSFFQYLDVQRLQNVCVIGTYIKKEMFGTASGVGEILKINGVPYTVVGVLEEKADSTENSSDDCIYIPYTNATRLNKNSSIQNFTVYATSEDAVDDAVEKIKNMLQNVLGDSGLYSVTSMKEIRDIVNDITGMLTKALVFIAGISLLVGGIGIMNIMLVTVTERTKEIGIRKALGTRKRDILNQFIIEAATLSAIGGIIGIAVGIGLSAVVGKVASITAVPTFNSIFLSFGISTGIGVGFGYIPAKRAADLNPIDALRFE